MERITGPYATTEKANTMFSPGVAEVQSVQSLGKPHEEVFSCGETPCNQPVISMSRNK